MTYTATERDQRPINPTQPSTRLPRRADERIDDHDENSEEAQNNFGREPVQIGNLLGREVKSSRRTCLSAIVPRDGVTLARRDDHGTMVPQAAVAARVGLRFADGAPSDAADYRLRLPCAA